jgi:hypothetical protein
LTTTDQALSQAPQALHDDSVVHSTLLDALVGDSFATFVEFALGLLLYHIVID